MGTEFAEWLKTLIALAVPAIAMITAWISFMREKRRFLAEKATTADGSHDAVVIGTGGVLADREMTTEMVSALKRVGTALEAAVEAMKDSDNPELVRNFREAVVELAALRRAAQDMAAAKDARAEARLQRRRDTQLPGEQE